MTVEEAYKSITEDGINLGAGDFVDPEALEVAAVILAKVIKGRLVEAVRCGECRFADTKECPMSGSAGRVSASDFCSYGERKDNGWSTSFERSV